VEWQCHIDCDWWKVSENVTYNVLMLMIESRSELAAIDLKWPTCCGAQFGWQTVAM